jgi:hypothetical protein
MHGDLCTLPLPLLLLVMMPQWLFVIMLQHFTARATHPAGAVRTVLNGLDQHITALYIEASPTHPYGCRHKPQLLQEMRFGSGPGGAGCQPR